MSMVKKKIALLGCTGSIGQSTLKVIAEHSEYFEITALSARKLSQQFLADIKKFKPKYVVLETNEKAVCEELPKDITIFFGEEGLCEIAKLAEVDIVVLAILGLTGLKPALAAVQAKKRLALATKEVLVAAGNILMESCEKYQAELVPIDSEHSAIFQCLQAESNSLKYATKLLLTASGGPFRNYQYEQLKDVKATQALKHPTWTMGNKITIDSATLMNKGLEVIEAYWLFGIDIANIEVLVHPQSIIHSMVEFCDKSVLAQLSVPDMRLAIQYALTYPRRLNLNLSALNFAEIKNLTFEQPDLKRFPCLGIAYEALRNKGTQPAILNAANELCVLAFLEGRIGFYDIPRLIEEALQTLPNIKAPNLSDILAIDFETKKFMEDKLSK